MKRTYLPFGFTRTEWLVCGCVFAIIVTAMALLSGGPSKGTVIDRYYQPSHGSYGDYRSERWILVLQDGDHIGSKTVSAKVYYLCIKGAFFPRCKHQG